MSKRSAPPLHVPEAGPLANAFAYGAVGRNLWVRFLRLHLGWGVSGVCPGPGVVAAGAGSKAAFAAVLSSIVGALV